MKIRTIILKTPSLFIFLLFATLLSSVYARPKKISTERTDKTANSKTRESYESEIKNRQTILLDSVGKDHPDYDSLIFQLYDNYKQQYLRFGGEGDWSKALPIVLACETTFIGELSSKEEADLIYNIAYIYDKNAQYFVAVDYYEKSIQQYEAIQDIGGQDVQNDLALAYNNLGVVHANTGFFTERKASYLKAKEIWESADDVNKSNLISLYGNLLRLYRQYGDKQAAEELITEINSKFDRWISEDAFAKDADKLETKYPKLLYYVEKHRFNILYTDLTSNKAAGIAHLDSLRTYFKSMRFEDQKRFSPYLLTAISGAAGPLVDYDNPAERKEKKQFLDLGMQESILYGDRYNEMIFHSLLVSYNLDAEQDAEKALWHLNEAIQIGHEMYIREFNLINLYLKKGDVLQESGQFLEAEKLVLKGMSVLLDQPISDPTVVQINDFAQRNDIFYINALKQVASIYKSEYESKKNPAHGRIAQHFYDLAARLFHVYYQKGAYNPWLNQTSRDINEGLLSLHLALEESNEVALVSMIENNRSQHLSKEFEAKYLRFLNIPDSLFTERDILQSELAKYDSDEALESEKYKALQGRLSELKSEIQQVDDSYFSFFSDTINIQEVQTAMEEGEYIVRYAVASENLYAYTIHKHDLKIVKLGGQDSLLRKVELYHEALKTIKNDYIDRAKELYTELIVPLQLPLDKVKNLVLIPDNKLNFLPFETLIHPDTNRPLVSLIPISYSHGLKMWLLQQKITPTQGDQQLFAAFAPQYSTNYMTAFVGNNPKNRSRLQDIAGATQEAVQLTQYFDGNLFKGDRATKEEFLQRTSGYKIYHFAMHALLDESDHLNSSLVFQDGEHLRYHELYSLHFPAEMVVLSACNTGMGKLESGEGLMSLSRALTYSGVRSAVYSLWEVPDEETAEIMLSFYGHLKSGLTKVAALTLAKRDFLRNNPLKSHPFFWAGFVINGNTETIDYTSPLQAYTGMIATVSAFLFIVLFAMLWKRNQRVKA